MQQCIDTLRLPDVHCLSVKISTLYSQISPLARKHTVSATAGAAGSESGSDDPTPHASDASPAADAGMSVREETAP